MKEGSPEGAVEHIHDRQNIPIDQCDSKHGEQHFESRDLAVMRTSVSEELSLVVFLVS